MNESVYQRTIKGQAAAVSRLDMELDAPHRRLLLLVNGFTSTANLARIARLGADHEAVALTLKSQGLIEEATRAPQ